LLFLLIVREQVILLLAILSHKYGLIKHKTNDSIKFFVILKVKVTQMIMLTH